MKILVLGAGGMAGHVVSIYFKEKGYSVETLSEKTPLDDRSFLVNVININELEKILKQNTYDVVINCIGILGKENELRPDKAIFINSYLPKYLENYYKNTHTKIIHISTDAVFSGNNGPYKENDTCDDISIYGRTKSLGEIINNKDATIRTSIVGPDLKEKGTGLFNWFMSQNGDIIGYSKVMWSGVTSIELARAIEIIINQKITGVLHLAPKENISKLNLLKIFKDVFHKKSITILPKNDISLDRTLLNTREDIKLLLPDYKAMVLEMRDWIISHSQLYKHYIVDFNNEK